MYLKLCCYKVVLQMWKRNAEKKLRWNKRQQQLVIICIYYLLFWNFSGKVLLFYVCEDLWTRCLSIHMFLLSSSSLWFIFSLFISFSIFYSSFFLLPITFLLHSLSVFLYSPSFYLIPLSFFLCLCLTLYSATFFLITILSLSFSLSLVDRRHSKTPVSMWLGSCLRWRASRGT